MSTSFLLNLFEKYPQLDLEEASGGK